MQKANKCLLALFITMGLIEIGYGVVLALLPLYLAQYLKVGLKYVGVIIAAFSLSELIFKTPGGWLADRIGRKPVLLVGVGLITFSFFLITTVKAPAYFLPIVAISGAGMAVTWPMTVAIIADLVEEGRRAGYMGTLGMVCLGGKGVGPALGSLAITITGLYEGPFYLNTVLAGISFFLVWFWVSDVFQAQKTKSISQEKLAKGGWLQDLIGILRHKPAILVLNGILFSQSLGLGVLIPIISLYANKVLGVRPEAVGTLLLGPVIAMSILTFITGKVADKVGKSKPIIIGMTLLSISMLVLPLSTHWVFLLAVTSLFGMGYAMVMPAWTAMVTEEVPEEQRGIVLGSVGTMQGLGFTIGPLMGTYIWDTLGSGWPFYICGFILTLGTLLAFWGIRGKR